MIRLAATVSLSHRLDERIGTGLFLRDKIGRVMAHYVAARRERE